MLMLWLRWLGSQVVYWTWMPYYRLRFCIGVLQWWRSVKREQRIRDKIVALGEDDEVLCGPRENLTWADRPRWTRD